jgi:hypothetical protein
LTCWALETVVADAAVIGAQIQKMPQPRSVPVAFLEWRGREVNLLTGSSGLPDPHARISAAERLLEVLGAQTRPSVAGARGSRAAALRGQGTG